MVRELKARYESKPTASRIYKMAELVSVKHNNIRDEISTHVSIVSMTARAVEKHGTSAWGFT